MESIVSATRRGGVILVSLVSVAAAIGLVSMMFSGGAVGRLSTFHLLGLLAMLILPVLTLGLLRLDQNLVRERGGR